MHTIHVPACGEGVRTATIRRWLKTAGQAVQAGDLLVELETEEGLVQLTAADAGTMSEILAGEGQTVLVGGAIARLSSGGSSSAPITSPPMHTAARSADGHTASILMPQAGNSMEEGTVLKWRVQVGDEIKLGQIICEIETDKATVEVEATAGGKIAWLAAEGTVIPVKQPIAFLGGAPAKTVERTAETAVPARAAAPVEPGAVAGARPRELLPDVSPVEAGAPASLPPGVVALLMPQAGNSMEEGVILKWRVKEGDRITVGQIICEVETDKATIEVEATDAGRVAKIVAPEGAVVPVKQPMAYLGEDGAAVVGVAPVARVVAAAAASGGHTAAEMKSVASSRTAATAPALATLVMSASNGGRVKASPAARKLAGERGVDLSSIGSGSGPGGRILSTDVASSKVAASGAATRGTPAGLGSTAGAAGTVRRPLSKMRRAIATNLQISKQTVPHFYVRVTINAEPLIAFYKAAKPATGCTINDVILLAVGKLVGEFPAFRSRIEGNEIVEFATANIGIAVGVEEGLVVPVVMAVDRMTLTQLAVETKRTVEHARQGRLENIGRGVFTISNMGMFGVEEFAAIINPPESGILAISAAREAVVVSNGVVRAGKLMTMTLSVDHRVVDGALAAQFVARLKERLEAPEKHLLI